MDEQLNALLALLEFELVPSPENGKIIFERFIADGAPEEVTMAGEERRRIFDFVLFFFAHVLSLFVFVF
jgi:hypothetical protein